MYEDYLQLQTHKIYRVIYRTKVTPTNAKLKHPRHFFQAVYDISTLNRLPKKGYF